MLVIACTYLNKLSIKIYYRSFIDLVDPKDYQGIVDMIRAQGVIVETQGLDEWIKWLFQSCENRYYNFLWEWSNRKIIFLVKRFIVWRRFDNPFGKKEVSYKDNFE